MLDFLDHLVDWAAEVPLLMLATARPELLVRRPSWDRGRNRAVVRVAPLSDDDTARLVAALLDQALLPAELHTALLGRAGGNPLFAEEYVRMLVDRGVLRQEGATLRLHGIDDLPLPETVQGIVAARLDALPPEDKSLLANAAILGKVGWLGALTAVSGSEPGTLEPRLRALERREFLRRERRSAVAGERQYAFRHVLVRDVAYSQLPRAARADKHRRAAESPDRTEDRAELLAHHYTAALQFAQAAGQDTTGLVAATGSALRDAGDRALELSSFAAAAGWYTASLELWPVGDPDRPRLLLRLGRSRFFAGETGADVTELLTVARDQLLAQGDLEAAADAEQLLGSVATDQGLGERALMHKRRAVGLLEEAGPSSVKTTALASLAGSLCFTGQAKDAIRLARRALVMAEEFGLDDEQTWALNFLGCARLWDGDPGGLADLERAVAIADKANLPESATAYGNFANMAIALGDLPRGLELQAEAQRVAERFGLATDLRWLRAERVFQAYWQGDWAAARHDADQFITEAAESPHFMERACRQVRALIRLAVGDPPGALGDATTAVDLATQVAFPEALWPALALHAHVLLAGGRAGEAGTRADELLGELAERGALPTNPDWSGQLAVVLFDLGRTAELTEVVAGAMPTPWLQAATSIAAGDFVTAADRYAGIGSLPDEAFARLRAAERLLAAGRRVNGNAQLQRALAFYRRVDATAYLRQGEALVAASA